MRVISRPAAGDMIRRLLLAWLLTGAIQYTCLPAPERVLSGFSALTGQSFPLLLVGTAWVPRQWALWTVIALRSLEALTMWIPFGPGDWQLFNLSNDRAEQRNLATQHPDKLAELKAAYAAYVHRNGVQEVPRLAERIAERYSSLNYFEALTAADATTP